MENTLLRQEKNSISQDRKTEKDKVATITKEKNELEKMKNKLEQKLSKTLDEWKSRVENLEKDKENLLEELSNRKREVDIHMKSYHKIKVE